MSVEPTGMKRPLPSAADVQQIIYNRARSHSSNSKFFKQGGLKCESPDTKLLTIPSMLKWAVAKAA